MSAEDAAPVERTASEGLPASRGPLLRQIPALAAPLLAAAFATSIYFVTSAPGAWWGDGLELTAAASTLGIPHPPGYPLYTVLGHLLLTLFDSLDAGRVMTLFSSALCAAGAALSGGVAYALLRGGSRNEEGWLLPSPVERGPAALAALGVTLAVAFSRTLWEHATFAEVYPLTFALVAGMTLTIVWPEHRDRTPGLGRIALLGTLAGLSALHHYSAAAAAPMVIAAAIAWGRRRNREAMHIGILLLLVVLLALGYLWIPFRAADNPPLNFGNPDSLSGLIWMLTGGQYAAIQALQAGGWAARLDGAERWLAWWGEQLMGPGHRGVTMTLGAVAVAMATAGNLVLAWRRPAWGLGGLALIGSTLIFALLYRIPDIEGYFLPALPAAVLGGAEIMRQCVGLAARPPARLMIGATFGVAAVLLGFGLFRSHLGEVDKSWDRGPQIWAGNLLEALPADALVLTRQGSDSEIYALWYAQMVEDKRPDVSVFGAGFIFSGWYASYFEAEGRPKIPYFVTDRPPGTKAEYDVALIGGVIVPNLKERRVFVTFRDPMFDEYFSPRPVAGLLPPEYYGRTAYQLNPPGPVLYELRRNLLFEPTAKLRFEEMYGASHEFPEAGFETQD